MKYGKLVNGTIQYAPKTVEANGHLHLRPTAEDYLTAGFKPVIDERPYTSPTEYAVAVGWEEFENSISRIYEIRPIEPQPRRWTPLTMKRAAVAKQWWASFREVLEQYSAYEDFLMCQFIAENDPMFQPIYQALCAKYGEEEVKNYLDGLEVE